MKELFARGRPGDPRLGAWVKPISSPKDVCRDGRRLTIAILGAPDDTGVRLNGGRGGAELGPDSIRRHFYKMAPPLDLTWENHLTLFDCGNASVQSDIRKTHANSKKLARSVATVCDSLIALGGGHDFAAPHFMGFVDGVRDRGGKLPRAALMNVDPHLDVRELENGLPHSGTPFREILDSQCILAHNLVQFGFRRNRNSRNHLSYCQQLKVELHPFEKLDPHKAAAQFQKILSKLSQRASTIGVTIDMDSCREAESTSAAPVVGFSALDLIQMAQFSGRNPKVNYFEIAEAAPSLDPAERASRIAAEMIYAFLFARAALQKVKRQ